MAKVPAMVEAGTVTEAEAEAGRVVGRVGVVRVALVAKATVETGEVCVAAAKAAAGAMGAAAMVAVAKEVVSLAVQVATAAPKAGRGIQGNEVGAMVEGVSEEVVARGEAASAAEAKEGVAWAEVVVVATMEEAVTVRAGQDAAEAGVMARAGKAMAIPGKAESTEATPEAVMVMVRQVVVEKAWELMAAVASGAGETASGRKVEVEEVEVGEMEMAAAATVVMLVVREVEVTGWEIRVGLMGA